jgi:glycosyltransferase involved in cell wall biosynthesis
MSYNIHKNSFLHTILRSVCINKAFQSDKIVFISEDAKKDFLDLKIPFGGEYTIIPNFIDTDQFYQTTNQSTLDDIYDKYQLPKKKIFIFVASSGHYKNNLTFLKIAHVFKEYHFIKVGDIDSECKQYIKDNGVTNVQLLHALPIDDLRALYTIAEACIYPSTKE